jgi:hypothetical protein
LADLAIIRLLDCCSSRPDSQHGYFFAWRKWRHQLQLPATAVAVVRATALLEGQASRLQRENMSRPQTPFKRSKLRRTGPNCSMQVSLTSQHQIVHGSRIAHKFSQLFSPPQARAHPRPSMANPRLGMMSDVHIYFATNQGSSVA